MTLDGQVGGGSTGTAPVKPGMSRSRTIIVTGAARGLGAEIATQLVAEGTPVLLGDVVESEARERADRLGALARATHLDVSDAASWDRAIAYAESELGPIGGLVSNAGIAHAGAVESLDQDAFEAMWRVNVLGSFNGIRSVTPRMRASGGGAIVVVGSIAAISSRPNLAGYGTSKWALRGLVRYAAEDLDGTGVRIAAVLPGAMDTALVQGVVKNARPGESPVADQPRFVRTEDVARTVTFLLSPAASATHGAEVVCSR